MKKHKKQIQLVQVNFTYGNNAYLPYSIGLLHANLLTHASVSANYEVLPPIYLRSDIEEISNSCFATDIIGISAYIWNWEWSCEFAKKAKEVSPNSLIVVGGPQVPHSSPDLFRDLLHFDVVVIGEGEQAFTEICEEMLSPEPDLAAISGLALNVGGERRLTAPRPRNPNPEDIPSPYLSGVLDDLVTDSTWNFQASEETHRGCPYSCTFCDWGSATMQKVKRFPAERIVAEYEWMAKNQIEVLYNCDANYGLFPEDEGLTEALVSCKRKFGFPSKFRAAYAKNSNDRVFRIARALNDAGMSKGVTLSLQSLDETTLEQIKRRNMRINDFASLIKQYSDGKMPTYTELIVALPGETFESFVKGISRLFEAGQHDGLNIYPAMVLPNAKLNDEHYKKLHGIQHVRTPMLLNHGSRNTSDIQEFYEIVISTRTMSNSEWVEAMTYSWLVQALHCMNLTQWCAGALRALQGIAYETFYGTFSECNTSSPTLVGNIELLRAKAKEVSEGVGSLDLRDDRFGMLIWPVEEILALRLMADGFLGELEQVLVNSFGTEAGLAEDLARFQRFSLKSLNSEPLEEARFENDWMWICNLGEKGIGLETKLFARDGYAFRDWADYAREVVWYGRKGSSMKRKLEYSSCA